MKIRNLCKSYDLKNGEKVHALKGVSFDLPSKGMVAILGKSGSGKSTLLNILSGLDSFDSGDVEAFGKNLKSFTKAELDNYRNSYISFVFQEYHLISELTVGENIALALQLQGEQNTDETVKSVLKQVELSGYEKRRIIELSGGQKQRVAIARALIKNPKIIFADEPTGALDSQTGESVLQILKDIAKEKLVILVTHDREFAERYGDRIIELADGEVISDTENTYRFTEKDPEMEMLKPRLPIKPALKIGCSNFKHHPFRFLSTVLLSVIAFSLLGIALTVGFMNHTEVYSNAIMDSDMEFTAIYKNQYYEDPNYINQSLDQFLGDDDRLYKEAPLTKEDVEYLEQQVGGSYTLVYSHHNTVLTGFQKSYAATINQINEAHAKREKHYATTADGFISMTKEECDRLGYVVIGRLPENSSEVAINEGIFNIFTLAGLIEDNKVYDISSYDDIIGHTITVDDDFGHEMKKTVTGVVITGCDYECFNTHYKPEDRQNNWNWEHYHDKIFVCQDYFDEYTYALCPLPENKSDLTHFINFVLESEKNDDYFFTVVNKLSSGFYGSYGLAILLKNLCLYLSVLFLFFALLLLSNFIFNSMRRQLKQIGVLSALGAGFKDLCKVYGSAVGVICSVITAITLLAQIYCVNRFNEFLRDDEPDLYFDIIPFSFPAMLLLVVIIAAVAAAGCLIPLIRLRKIDPTKIINKGQVK